MSVVEANVKNCQRHLKKWSKESFGNISLALVEKKNQIKVAEGEAVRSGNGDRLHVLKVELRELLIKEEKLWQQRSKLHWLKEGDQNTRYFHGKASQRYRKNCIKRLRNKNGEWVDGEDQIAQLFIDYYSELFTTSNPSHLAEVLENIPQVVSDSMNADLVKPFVKQEVDVALKQMAPLKAPGLDGMPPIFYQHYWDSIGDDVSCAVLSCLNSGSIPASLNHTHITLIPKIKKSRKCF